MRSITQVIPFAILTLASFNSNGQDTVDLIINQSYLKNVDAVDCDNAPTTFEMRICTYREFQYSDSIMNSWYQEVLSEMTSYGPDLPTWKSEFETSQISWKQFRDEHCKVFAKSYEGGSLQPVVNLECLLLQTEKRIDDLSKLLEELR